MLDNQYEETSMEDRTRADHTFETLFFDEDEQGEIREEFDEILEAFHNKNLD
jgi:hypothetical protein